MMKNTEKHMDQPHSESRCGGRFTQTGIRQALFYTAAAATLLPMGFVEGADEPLDPRLPNILFILTDDLGYGDVGAYGQSMIPTPRFDRLAQEGMLFTSAYAGAPVCGPSRSVLMTGQHTGHTTVRGNNTQVGGIGGRGKQKRPNLADDDITIGHVLGKAGYRSGLVGKWHLDGNNPAAGPLDRGFDEFYGWLISEPDTYNPSNYYPAKRFRNRELFEIKENRNRKQGLHHADMCINEAISFLDSNQEKPFFLYLAFNLPHNGHMAVPPDFDPFADKDWPDHMKLYGAMVSYMDHAIGVVLDHLEKLGLADNTIVFLTSDNGPRSDYRKHLREMTEFFDSNGPLRGYKRDLYEGGIRIPMIVRWPGHVAAGAVSDEPWYFADVMPTLAAIASTEVPEKIDGVSVLPTLLGKNQNLSDRFLYWEFHEGGFKQAVRWKNHKAVRLGVDASLELYDLNKDIGETTDIAADHPEIIKTIEEHLKTSRTESPYWIVR